jgi:hypothetical protein
MSAIKNCIVVVKSAFLCVVHALIMARSKVNGGPKNASYRKGKQFAEELLSAFSVDLTNGGSLKKV